MEKISVNNRIITHSDKGIVIKRDVIEIGWNDRYLLYKRVFIDSNIEEVEIGIIDTESGEILYLDEDEIRRKLLELNVTDEISLKNVAMFFSETRGFYNNN
ncbi:hypothetical protein [Alkaliphilus transvaalensis]|uniref:hypothetical protein n=1 Tax=Alkaliphilus transvaalensis TaxID=114628 RepID=UPI00047C659A|nr:hypothetical protein [Alkaliphilus transvaalensis]